MKSVSIIGAGFAGLTLALRLRQKGFEVDLYEKSDRVGGLLGTHQTPWGPSEQAANALIGTQAARDLFAELELTPVIPKKESQTRFIFRDQPRRWPLSMKESLSLIRKIAPRLFLRRSSLKPQEGQTLRSWGEHNLGPLATDYILEPAMQGIYANESSRLSASLILGPLFNRSRRRERYRGMLSGPQGLQDLVDALERKLISIGVRIHKNSSPRLKDLKHPWVLATSVAAAAVLLQDTHPTLSNTLSKVRMSSLISAKVFFTKPHAYKGFGCLVPRKYGFKTLGVLMNSHIFPGRDKTYSETWILQPDTYLIEDSDEKILSLVLAERKKIFGQSDALIGSQIHRWEKALPTYDTKLEEVLRELPSLLPKGGYLHGNYLGGIGLSKILERSHQLAQEIEHAHG